MNQHWLAIIVLCSMFALSTALPINMGVIAFVGAFLVGTLVAGMSTKAIMAGFPADLFLTLAGITYLFALAQNNGTIDWLVRLAVRAVRGRIGAIPWIMFLIAALLTSVGAVSPAAVAIIAPIALGFAFRYGINPLMMGLLVVHGAQAGGFSPISIYGGITNTVVSRAGLPLNELYTMTASFAVNLAVSILLFFAFGGRRLMRLKADAVSGEISGNGNGDGIGNGDGNAQGQAKRPASQPPVSIGQRGAQVYGDAESESLMEEKLAATPGSGSLLEAATPTPATSSRAYQMATVLGLVALAVLTLVFKLDIGFVSLTIALILTIMAPNLQKGALGQVSWPEIMLIVGVSTYVGVLEKMGTIDFVGNSVASLASPLIAALVLCFVGAVVSAFASSTAVLGSLIPLAVPFLQGDTGVSAIGFIAAMAVSSTIVDVSPFSTNGALVLANAKGVDRTAFFRQLLAYGALITVVAPVICWLLFVVL